MASPQRQTIRANEVAFAVHMAFENSPHPMQPSVSFLAFVMALQANGETR